MNKPQTESLTKLNGIDIELGVTKIRGDVFEEGLYVIPVFINETLSVVYTSHGDYTPVQTDAPWELYSEELHGVGNMEHMSVEDYIQGLKDSDSSDDLAMYIIEKMDDLLGHKQYGRVKEILDAINFDEYEDAEQVIVSSLVSSNPVSPLLRAIPKKENVHELNVARCRFYDRGYEYMKDKIEEGELKSLFHGLKPKDYDEDVKFYDAIYAGGAPKEA